MYRVTTPTHTFVLPALASSYKEVQITYTQSNAFLVKHYQNETLPSGMTFEGNKVIIRLTQEETKRFSARKPAQVQVRVLTSDDDVYASKIFNVTIERVLNEEVLHD